MRGALLGQLGQDAFQNWIDPLVFVGADQGVVHLAAPTSFIGTWVSRNYGDAIRQLLCKDGLAVSRLEFGVAPPHGPAPRGPLERRCRPAVAPRGRATSTCRLAARRRAAPSTTSWSASRTSSPMRGAAGGRRRAGRVQPAVPLWRRRPRQDAPDARHRLGGDAEQSRGAGALPLGRAVHVPLRLGAALQGDARLQGDVPLGRHADGRRRAVHLRQGFDAGGVLPHLQRADRAAEADRDLRRPRAGRDRRARGADPVAAAVGAGRRPAPDRLRAPARHPAGQGRGAARAQSRA